AAPQTVFLLQKLIKRSKSSDVTRNRQELLRDPNTAHSSEAGANLFSFSRHRCNT
ncbi:hypothetical protein GOODEAATRI_020872, partial [Goodea atripinnis]